MGSLIRSFTVGRNFLKRTTAESADAAHQAIELVSRGGLDLQVLKSTDNGRYNIIRDLMSFTGILKRDANQAIVTEVGTRYLTLYAKSHEDAWRWLVTRSLWLYVMPNGTDTEGNRQAQSLNASFAFFHLMLGLLSAMSALPNDDRYVSYEELCFLLNDDANWTKSPVELLQLVLTNRATGASSRTSTRLLLGDLEEQYQIGRDNLNTVLNKAFFQTGLFEYKPVGNASRGAYGIALTSVADPVLQRRIRFVLDHRQVFSPGGDWNAFLQPRTPDLPLEVSEAPAGPGGGAGVDTSELSALESDALELLRERKNVIFFGPPGTGKSHSAFSIADAWSSRNGEDSLVNVTFHPAFGYEDFVQGFRPIEDHPGQYALQPGPLMLAAEQASKLQQSGRAVLMVIDEINRGDVARIFGELITYIEPDKRGRHCRLAQSPKTEFYVPDNLYFLGTMNSADKSVSLLDVALRRRFAFVEIAPDPSVYRRLDKWLPAVNGLEISAVLTELNTRLLQSGVEPDRCIGHALLGVPSGVSQPDAALSSRFRYDVIPLIQEYCYLDRPRMRRILGQLIDEAGRPAWRNAGEFMQLLSQFVGVPLTPVVTSAPEGASTQSGAITGEAVTPAAAPSSAAATQ
jgi:hypothetical protein